VRRFRLWQAGQRPAQHKPSNGDNDGVEEGGSKREGRRGARLDGEDGGREDGRESYAIVKVRRSLADALSLPLPARQGNAVTPC
jgi:hypothetical protein